MLKAAHAINKFRDSLLPLYDFIIDNPYETDEDIIKTLRLILTLPRPYGIMVFSLAFYPGSELYDFIS